MADVLKIRGDLLGLGKSSIEPVKARKHKTSTILAVATLALVLIGASSGAIRELVIEREKAEQAAAAQAAAEEKAKNRERDARAKALTDLAMRYQYELEQQRKRVVGTIENAESYRDQIPQVKKFLAEYQLPEDVNMAIRQPVDMMEARGQDSYAIELHGATEPTNLKEKYAKWRELLAAAGRYAEGIDRNNAYFNGYLKEMRIDEQFKREFGRKPLQQQGPVAPQPQAEAKPVTVTVTPAEPVVEQAAVEPAAPIAEAAPAPAPKPAARPAAAPKPKTVPVGGGRVQVTDW